MKKYINYVALFFIKNISTRILSANIPYKMKQEKES